MDGTKAPSGLHWAVGCCACTDYLCMHPVCGNVGLDVYTIRILLSQLSSYHLIQRTCLVKGESAVVCALVCITMQSRQQHSVAKEQAKIISGGSSKHLLSLPHHQQPFSVSPRQSKEEQRLGETVPE
jgi:hypothetical protein